MKLLEMEKGILNVRVAETLCLSERRTEGRGVVDRTRVRGEQSDAHEEDG